MTVGSEPSTGEYDWNEAAELATAVVEAVAAETGREEMAMQPLYEVIDPDALNTLFAADDHAVAVSFTYETVDVRIENDGKIITEPAGQ